MNNLKKISLIIMFLLLSTGCSVSSNITINKDLSVIEEVQMTGTSEFFSNRYKSLPLTVVKSVLESENRENILKENGYKYEIIKTSSYPYVLASKKYTSIENFTNNTIFKEQYFENLLTIKNDNLITIKASGFINYEEGDLERYDIKKFSLNIKVPYVVTENNADEYNPKTNTYTWTINQDTKEKEIKLTFDKNRIYVYNLFMYISIFILCMLVVILILLIRMVIKKNKINNKIAE